MRILTNVCADDLALSRAFYVALLGLDIQFDSDWYVQLSSPSHPENEFGIIQRDHELVPEAFRQPASGMYVTFVVDDVEETFARAVAMEATVVQAPQDEFYGQRRCLILDPSGCLLDICSPIAPL